MEGEGSVNVIVSIVGVRLGFFSLKTYGVWEGGSTKLNDGTFEGEEEWTTSSSMLF